MLEGSFWKVDYVRKTENISVENRLTMQNF